MLRTLLEYGLLVGLLCGLGACASEPVASVPVNPMGGDKDVFCPEGAATKICVSGQVVDCAADGTAKRGQDCIADGLNCFPGLGCAVCRPGEGSCDGETTRRCRDDGSGYDDGDACKGTAASHCNIDTGVCADLCAEAERGKSYIGCDYWATTTANLVDELFSYAVVVSNPQAISAVVTVTQGTTVLAEETVEPGGVETIKLPWVPEIKQAAEHSVLMPSAAYHIESDVPVAAYEFSALEFRIEEDCQSDELDQADDGQCFSFSNDASLLFPTHVLRGDYMALTVPGRRTRQRISDVTTHEVLDQNVNDGPGFVTVIGADEEPTPVTIRTPAYLAASADGVTVATMSPGDEQTFTLGKGDVLELVNAFPVIDECPEAEHPRDTVSILCPDGISECSYEVAYCALHDQYDLSGLTVQSEGHVAVIAGHQCAFVPEYRYACDHLEESIPAFETWGKTYFLGATEPLQREPNYVRVLAGEDNTKVSFSAEDMPDVTLNRGEIHSFETKKDLLISADHPILVGQFLVGQAYANFGSVVAGAAGDPSLSVVTPVEQYRKSYAFLVPDTYTSSFITVVASASQDVLVDGTPLTGWKLVGNTGYKVVRAELEAGTHRASADAPFGLIVYGYASFTSYLYPGGLDFNPIAAPL